MAYEQIFVLDILQTTFCKRYFASGSERVLAIVLGRLIVNSESLSVRLYVMEISVQNKDIKNQVHISLRRKFFICLAVMLTICSVSKIICTVSVTSF